MSKNLTIEDIISKNLHLPLELRTATSRIHFGAMLFKIIDDKSNIDDTILFKDVSLMEFTYSFFDIYLKEMFKYGYKLSKMNIRQEYKPVELNILINRLININAVSLVEKKSKDINIFNEVNNGLKHSSNLERYLKDFKYLPVALRDFSVQKKLLKILLEKSKNANLNLTFMQMQVFAFDYFSHFLVYTGYTIQKSKQKLPFINMDKELEEYENKEKDLFLKLLNK